MDDEYGFAGGDGDALDESDLDLGAALSTYVTFDLAGQTLGVQVRNVREILDLQPIARLPNAPAAIEGMIDVRGQSVPIFDLGDRLGLPRGEHGEDSRIIVFEVGAEAEPQAIGIVADKVRNVTQIPSETIESPPDMAGGAAGTLTGIARTDGQIVLLLELGHVFGCGLGHQRAPGLDFAL